MTIREFYDKLPDFTDEERQEFGAKMANLFSGPSMSTMMEFQSTWDPSKGPVAFFKEQVKKFRECLKLEMATIGKTVREIQKLPAISWETEL